MWRIICHWRIAERFSLFVSFFVFLSIFFFLAFSSSRSDTFTKFMTIVRTQPPCLPKRLRLKSMQKKWTAEKREKHILCCSAPSATQIAIIVRFHIHTNGLHWASEFMHVQCGFIRPLHTTLCSRASIHFIYQLSSEAMFRLPIFRLVRLCRPVYSDWHLFIQQNAMKRAQAHAEKSSSRKIIIIIGRRLVISYFSCWCITIKSIIRRSTPLLSPSSEI